MKIIKCLTLSLLLISFVSCSKQPAFYGDSISMVNRNKINLLYKLSVPEQKVSYSLLSPLEKQAVWLNKFELIKVNETMQDAQAKFIDKCILFINTNFLFDKIPLQTNQELEELRESAIALFGQEKAAFLLATIELPNSTGNNVGNVAIPPPIKCNCSKLSDYCLTGTCASTTPNCETKEGCGTFWAYTCDGKCNK
ncbi:MAG: bacteriocin fulvocin C-related protein [Sphingobacteriales bacterium]|nr:bacteriocin fulvocin C-related protein [Sphingobacteriales bacterium]